jgi:hypothetical protein
VLTLSTGVVHPLVIGHAGCFKTWEGNSTLSFSVFGIRVWGDFIAAGTSGGFVPIWNWKTAALVSCEVREHENLERPYVEVNLFIFEANFRHELLVVRLP